MKICIDAGHGGTDSGAVGVGRRLEKADNLKMALALQEEMQKRGHSVVMTRTSDAYPSLSDRYRLANASAADAYISLHRNSAGADAHGVEVLYRTITVKSAGDNLKSAALAAEIDKRIVSATGFRDRGAKVQNTNTAVLQYSKMPAVTVEAGFVSNAPTNGTSESDNARFDRTFAALISAVADGLEAQFGTVSGADVAPAPFVPPRALPYTFSAPYCKKGERGERVSWVQARLNVHKALPGGKVDGIFGTNTEKGVKAFQAARKNEGRDIGAVDGIVGPKTAAILAE